MFIQKEKYVFSDLVEIVAALRGEGGCPWDMEQNHQSIRTNLLEETYEVLEAIDNSDIELLREELGDVLLQVVFHAQMEREQGTFDVDDVADGICKKLVYRHPHVFGSVDVDNTDEVLANWEKLKSKSKGEQTATESLQSVPTILPALIRGEKVGKKARAAGFDFPDLASVLSSLKSEIEELELAIVHNDEAEIEEEFGDILLSCCNLGRFLKKDSEKALTSAINKFIIRFRAVENLALKQNKRLNSLTDDELDKLWEKIKASN